MAPGEEKMRVAVMGATGSGKSTFINVASGSNLAVSSSLESCTVDVETATFFLDGRVVTLVDTPGFDDTTRTDTDVLTSITEYLADSYNQGAKLAGVIYMQDISKNKMSGPSRRNFNMLCNLCGDNNLKSVLLVTNMWSGVDRDVGEARERELRGNKKFFKSALDKGARMFRHDGSQASAYAILHQLEGLEPSTLLVQDEMVNQEKDLAHTTVGIEIMRELKEQSDRHAKALEHLCREIEEARLAEDEETREVLQEEAQQAREEIERIRGDLERMVTNFAAENSRLETENRRYKKSLKKQKADAEHNAQLYERERRAREIAEAAQRRAEALLAAEREAQEREERERRAREIAEALLAAERETQEREKREREKQEHERQEREKRERERQDRERHERERQDRERHERERRDREKQEREREERERQERERQKRERRELEQRERDQQERERREREKEEERKKKESSTGCVIQ